MNLQLQDLSKSFAERRVFDRAHLNLPEFRALVLIGPSGGGKSTLLRLLGGLEIPDSGQVVLDGSPLPFADQPALRRHRLQTGFVFQAHNLFPHLNALQNIQFPLEKVHGVPAVQARQQARDWLARFRLESHAHQHPYQLSGGQRQRVAIARALAVQPRLLLLDEPTSALDPEMTGEVLDAIESLRTDGRTFVLVTHQMGFARQVADQIAFVGDGGILAHGPACSVLDAPPTPAVARFLERVLRY